MGKTTLTVNVAAAVASYGKRVLLVDADPQCNLSLYLLDESVLDDYLDNSDEPDGKTIWSALQPVAEAIGEVRKIKAIELSIANVFLLVGDIRLSDFEQELWTLWNDCQSRRPKGFRGTSSISALINHICETRGIDYVFYDSGPNIGVLNKVVLLDCDWFIVPAACDLFSLRALRTLGHSVSSWINDWATFSPLAPDGMYILPGRPKFLGYIPQRFKVYRGQVASGYARYLSRIERRVNSDIVSVLRRIDPELASKSMKDQKLGEVKDYATIANEAQVQGVTMANVAAGTAQQRLEADAAFHRIAKQIIARTSN